jgi:branched-chain amino acid transport system permease protein
MGIYLILALALQLTVGYTGLLNLGHIAFYAIGAYTTAILSIAGFSLIICIFASGLFSSFSGYVLSQATSRFKGDSFAIATMSFSLVVFGILLNWTPLAHGPIGVSNIHRTSLLGWDLSRNWHFALLVFFILVIFWLFIRRAVNSPFGRVMRAIRDDELAVQLLGKDTAKVKRLVLSGSAFAVGMAGSLYAYYIKFIDPFSFSLLQMLPVLSIVIIGGLASLRGTLLATIVFILIPEFLRLISFPDYMVGPVRQVIFSVLIILILFFRPRGMWGEVELT